MAEGAAGSGASPEIAGSTPKTLINQDKGTSFVTTENGNEVSVSWRKFDPKQKAADHQGKAVIYIPGWVMQSDAVSVEDLPQAFADASGTQAFAIDTTPKKPQEDYKEEMKAVLRLLLESGIKELTITGHSNGAIKAVELALLLKELRGTPQEIKVNGLVLMDSTHMYNQNPAILAANAVKVSAQEMIHEEPNKASKAAGGELLKALQDRITYSGRDYLKVFLNQLKDMSKINPRTSEIDVPVVVFTSDKNPVADYKKVAPIEPSANPDRFKALIENKHKRQNYLQSSKFTSTPDIHVIVPRGYHNTLPVRRFEGTAKAGLYYLKQLAYQRERAAKI